MYSLGHHIARGEGRRRGRRRRRYELPLTSVANPRDYLVNRWGPPAFCWVAGDGDAPTVGPALTATGAPGSIAGPWELEDGTRLPLETYTGAECRVNTTPLDPAAGEDIVAVVIGRMPSAASAGQRILSTRIVGNGILISANAANQIGASIYTSGGGGASTPTAGHVAAGALYVVVVIFSRVANTVTTWTKGGIGASGAVPVGTISGGGIAIAADPNAANKLTAGAGVLAAALYHGAGKAAEWTAGTYARCEEILAISTSLEPRGNQAAKGRPTCVRASAASWYDADSRLWIASSGLMRAGDPVGLRRAPARTNKVYNNINPQVTTGWTATGGTHTVTADAAALATAKLEAAGPNVHSFVPGAGDQVLYGGAATAGTALHCLSVYLRGNAGGEEVVVGLRDASSGVVQVCGTVTLTTGWVRYVFDGVTPADSDQVFALDCDAGDTVFAVLPQLEAGEFSTSPIPNWATAAAAVRAAETIDPPVTPANNRGKVSCGITPLGFSGAVAGGASLIARTTGGSILGVSATADDYASSDGTTEVAAGAVADGVRAAVTVEWSGTVEKITVDAASDSDTYDGVLAGSGTYRLQSTLAETAIDTVIIEGAT